MKFEERFTCEVFRNTFEIRFHHDSSGTLWYKCLCLGSTCMHYLDLHSIRKAQSIYNHHCVKTLMEGQIDTPKDHGGGRRWATWSALGWAWVRHVREPTLLS